MTGGRAVLSQELASYSQEAAAAGRVPASQPPMPSPRAQSAWQPGQEGAPAAPSRHGWEAP